MSNKKAPRECGASAVCRREAPPFSAVVLTVLLILLVLLILTVLLVLILILLVLTVLTSAVLIRHIRVLLK